MAGTTLLSLAHMSRIHGLDAERMTVRAGGGATLGALCRYLSARGAALKNLPSFPHLTLGGALATATHGSGLQQRNLAAGQVRSLELMLADGTTRRFARPFLHGSGGTSLGCDVVPEVK